MLGVEEDEALHEHTQAMTVWRRVVLGTTAKIPQHIWRDLRGIIASRRKYICTIPSYRAVCTPTSSSAGTPTGPLFGTFLLEAMLDHVSVFCKSGLVLWSRTMAKLKGNPVDDLVKNVLLEEKGGTNLATTEWYTLR